jgi:hypothetical protein
MVKSGKVASIRPTVPPSSTDVNRWLRRGRMVYGTVETGEKVRIFEYKKWRGAAAAFGRLEDGRLVRVFEVEAE